MIDFQKKTNIFASFQASPDEWDGIKSILNAAANSEVYENSELERASGRTLPLSEIEALSDKLQNVAFPPTVLGKSDVQTLLAVCQNLTDARVEIPSLDKDLVSNIEEQMQNYNAKSIFGAPQVM